MEIPKTPPPTAGRQPEALGEAGVHSSSSHKILTDTISEPTPINEQKKAANGLTYTTMVAGTGASVQPGDMIRVSYVGRLADGSGKQFDANESFELEIGSGQVIKGWDLGIPGMKVGEKRKIVIPSDLGYGTKGYPPTIPANANLAFDVTILEITKTAPEQPKPAPTSASDPVKKAEDSPKAAPIARPTAGGAAAAAPTSK
jgi:hypothetical protein